jgi:hypothetical protein
LGIPTKVEAPVSLLKLIQGCSSENKIQSFVKSNLQILGEACTPSSISGEYVAFSQFPILEGRTDFVVFTSRSRMAVVVVEIKGANFPFLTSKGTLSAKITEAHQQVLSRFGHIEDNYELFRRRFHAVRRRIEKGEALYSAHVGPAKQLQVDPEKHIWVSGMVIGGRSVDDRRESDIRHRLERSSPFITFDTWDGWLSNNGHYDGVVRANYPKVSSPRDRAPKAFAEPHVSLSTHTAPTIQRP